MSSAFLLLRIALRNIFSSFLNVIIGLIILAGTLFFVMGGSLIQSMDGAMSKSIIGSVAGHAQIYAASSKDKPDLFNGWQAPELDPIPNFGVVKKALLKNPNIKYVVPMGISTAIVNFGNSLDQALEKLRANYRPSSSSSFSFSSSLPSTRLLARSGQAHGTPEEIASLKAHLRQMVSVIQGDVAKLNVIAAKGAVDRREVEDLDKAASNSFWKSFDSDPLGHLEFLENRIAYLLPDADQIFFSYIGTDLDAFAKGFDRLSIVDGSAVPKGQRGLLLPKLTYEKQFKLKIANRLDDIHEAVAEKHKRIDKDPDLRELVKQNRTQTREIILQLDPLSTKKAVALLQGELKSKEAELPKLLSQFLDTDDSNFEARYKVFYSGLAPMLELYRLKPGDSMTIKAYTKSGFVQAVNIKVYGTFQFKGLEKSSLAGALSLMDMISFRELYGFVTPESLAETKALQRSVGAKVVSRENAEADLFGGGKASLVGESNSTVINDKAELGMNPALLKAESGNRAFSRAEIENGATIEAALILNDPSKLKQTLLDVQKISDDEKLGLKVLDWQAAAGNIGQFVMVCKGVLYFATFIIFVVALVIINNAVVMATLQRVREIGTLRAIGAQRSFVLSMVLAETVILGLAFGAIGSGLGSLFMILLQRSGIPAGNEFLYFFFSGPRLYPSLSLGSLVSAFFVVLFVTCASALYPAIMATRISPIQAMASED